MASPQTFPNDWATTTPSTDHFSTAKKVQKFRSLMICAQLFLLLFVAATIVLACFLAQSVKQLNASDANGDDGDSKRVPQKATAADTENAPSYRFSDSPLGNYSSYAVAADNGDCSAIGREILTRGGNAVDAAIAVDLCIGIKDAHSSGIGGGFIMTVYNRTTKECSVVDAREQAPAAASETMYVGDTKNSSQTGYLAIAVPGELHGLYTAYKNFGGKLPWAELLQPTIALTKSGQKVSPALAKAIKQTEDIILADPGIKQLLTNKVTRQLYKAGETLRMPKFAKMLEELANAPDPIELFYQGAMAQKFVDEFSSHGGIITLDDLKAYKSIIRQPLKLHLKNGLIVCGPPPPSGAAVAMAILNILDGYKLKPSDLDSTADAAAETYHRIIEAMKFSYAARTELGDMDFVPEALEIAMNITTPAWAEAIRGKISDVAHSDQEYYGGIYQTRNGGTSHFSVVDAEGNAVSMTTTINLYFGSRRVSESTEIIWNNEMDDFSTPGLINAFGYRPSPANFIRPGKRPLSSMSPIITFDPKSGNVRLVNGAAGGSNIISSTAYIATRNLWLGENIKQAIDAPRLHHQLLPFYAEYEEPTFPKALLKLLKERHKQQLKPVPSALSAAVGIERTPGGQLLANSEYRKAGGFPSGD